MAHTPGPWDCDEGDFTIYELDGMKPIDFGYEPNARLIAAAPDLLAIAKDARHFLNGMVEIARIIGLAGTSEWDTLFGTNDGFGLIDEIDAAIAKAEGAHVTSLEAKERT